jgi:hypothetical protein
VGIIKFQENDNAKTNGTYCSIRYGTVGGMLYSASKMGLHNMNDVNQGGFVLVASVLLFGIGLFAQLFNVKK